MQAQCGLAAFEICVMKHPLKHPSSWWATRWAEPGRCVGALGSTLPQPGLLSCITLLWASCHLQCFHSFPIFVPSRTFGPLLASEGLARGDLLPRSAGDPWSALPFKAWRFPAGGQGHSPVNGPVLLSGSSLGAAGRAWPVGSAVMPTREATASSRAAGVSWWPFQTRLCLNMLRMSVAWGCDFS